MAENEELKVNEDEGEISVGGEQELKVKEAQEELKIKEKSKPQDTPEEEKKEGVLENEPNETGGQKGNHGDFEFIKEQDISQYLWDTLLKYMNKGLKKVHDWTLDAVDSGLSKHERGPAKPQATKEEKKKHTTNRGKELYDLRQAVSQDFANSLTDEHLNSMTNFNQPEDRNAFKGLLVRSQGIAYDMAVSELLSEKMSKDKNFDFANADTKSLIGEVKVRIREKQEKLMAGIQATAFYSENIEGMSSREALKACDEYLSIRENESNDIKGLITQDLENGNFVANDKKPTKDVVVKLNAYNRSFEHDAGVIHSSLKEAVTILENSNLSTEEKISLQEFQEKANLFQKFEAGAALDLQRQIKAVDEAYKSNKSSPLRARIAAMKQSHGLSPVSQKMVQNYANNAIIRAAATSRNKRLK